MSFFVTMNRVIAWVNVGVLGTVFFLGCSSEPPPPPPPLAPAEAPATFQHVFEKAQPEVQTDASKLAQSLASGNYTDAFVKLGGLSSRPDLSPVQREAVGRAQMTVMEKLREAAARGDPEALKLLELHGARK